MRPNKQVHRHNDKHPRPVPSHTHRITHCPSQEYTHKHTCGCNESLVWSDGQRIHLLSSNRGEATATEAHKVVHTSTTTVRSHFHSISTTMVSLPFHIYNHGLTSIPYLQPWSHFHSISTTMVSLPFHIAV